MKVFGFVLMSALVFGCSSEAVDSEGTGKEDNGSPQASNLETKAKNLTQEALSQDIRTKVERIEEGICGGDGPSFIVEVQVKHLLRTEVIGEFDEEWETIKTYGISEADLATQGAPVMMDSEACSE